MLNRNINVGVFVLQTSLVGGTAGAFAFVKYAQVSAAE